MTQPPQYPDQSSSQPQDPYGQPPSPYGTPYGQGQFQGQSPYGQPPSPYGTPQFGAPGYGQYFPKPYVSFGQAIRLGFSNYVNFRGRASRSEYWWWWLFNFIVTAVPVTISLFLLSPLVEWYIDNVDRAANSPYTSSSDLTQMPDFTPAMSVGVALYVLVGLIGLALLIPNLAIVWRRLHDGGFPGPLFFLSFVPYVGGLVVLILMIMPSKPSGMKYEY